MQIHRKGKICLRWEQTYFTPFETSAICLPTKNQGKNGTSIECKPLKSQDLFNSFHYPLQPAQECQVKKNELKKRVFLARDHLAYFPKHWVACSSDITHCVNGMGNRGDMLHVKERRSCEKRKKEKRSRSKALPLHKENFLKKFGIHQITEHPVVCIKKKKIIL